MTETLSCNFCNKSLNSDKKFITHMIKHKDDIKGDNSTMIGRGENTLIEILREKLPNVEIYAQIHLKYLVPKEEVELFSERQKKETLDVVILYRNKWICFRVQHGSNKKYHSKGHLGKQLSQADLVQKRLIQRYHGDTSVIELRESECKMLFRNKNNWYSQSEVGIQCMLEGLKIVS